jgi:hypothetical protein
MLILEAFAQAGHGLPNALREGFSGQQEHLVRLERVMPSRYQACGLLTKLENVFDRALVPTGRACVVSRVLAAKTRTSRA